MIKPGAPKPYDPDAMRAAVETYREVLEAWLVEQRSMKPTRAATWERLDEAKQRVLQTAAGRGRV